VLDFGRSTSAGHAAAAAKIEHAPADLEATLQQEVLLDAPLVGTQLEGSARARKTLGLEHDRREGLVQRDAGELLASGWIRAHERLGAAAASALDVERGRVDRRSAGFRFR
jgi:hypothetical protein